VTAVGYISDPEKNFKTSWSLFQHDGVAAFKLSGRSPLPLALSAKDLAGGRTQILNVRPIRTINYHAVESDQYCAPEIISDTTNWLNWNGNLDNPTDGEANCTVDDESDIERANGIQNPESPEQQDVSAARNIPELIGPTLMSKRHDEHLMVTVNTIKTRRNKRIKQR